MLLERHEAALRHLETLWTTRTDGRWELVCSLLTALDNDAVGAIIRGRGEQLARLVDRRRREGTVVYMADRLARHRHS